MLAAVTVFVWARAGLVAAVALVMLLAIMIPLARTVGGRAQARRRPGRAAAGLRRARGRGRAAGVRPRAAALRGAGRRGARAGASRRVAARRPDAALIAIRQDAGRGTRPTPRPSDLDEAIAETRALISAFHPATVARARVRGVAAGGHRPVPGRARRRAHRAAARSTTARSPTRCCSPVAQELVVNAVKHADPTAIDVVVTADGDDARARGQRRRRRHRHRAGRPCRPGRPRRARDGAAAGRGRRRALRDRDAASTAGRGPRRDAIANR